MEGFNWVDYTILIVFLFSVLAGLMRGIVNEVLSIVAWVAAFVVAGMFSGRLATYFTSSEAGQSVISGTTSTVGMDTTESVSMLSLGISFVALFLVTLMLGAIIKNIISGSVNTMGMGLANRLFGGIFGIIRGFLINLVLVFLTQLTAFANEPVWRDSKLVPSFQPAVAWLDHIVHPGLETLKSKVNSTFNSAESVIENLYRG